MTFETDNTPENMGQEWLEQDDTAGVNDVGQDPDENAQADNNPPADDAPQEPNQENTDTETDKAKRPSRAKMRIEQLTKQIAQMREQLDQQQGAKSDTVGERPKLEDFDDFGAYEDALEDYRIQKAYAKLKAEQEKANQGQKQAELANEFALAVDELAKDGVDVQMLQERAETLPPLPVTLDNFGLGVKETLLLAKQLMDDEPLYLELSQMSPVQMAMRVGQLINTPKDPPPPPKQSKAPPPIKPVGANASVPRNDDALSDDEWYKNQIKNRNKGR